MLYNKAPRSQVPSRAGRARISLRMGGCARLLSCKTVKATLGAPMPQTHQAKVEGPGAMSRRRWAHRDIRTCFQKVLGCYFFSH